MRTMKSSPPGLKSRWFQFSLRSLLIVVTIVCVVGGWIGNKIRVVRERREMLFARLNQPDRWGVVFDSQTVGSSGNNVDSRTPIGFVPRKLLSSLAWPPSRSQPSILEKWLGDNSSGIRLFCIPVTAHPADVAKVTELSPDAIIHRTSDAEIAILLSDKGGPPVPHLRPLTPADRKHLSLYYNALAANPQKAPPRCAGSELTRGLPQQKNPRDPRPNHPQTTPIFADSSAVFDG